MRAFRHALLLGCLLEGMACSSGDLKQGVYRDPHGKRIYIREGSGENYRILNDEPLNADEERDKPGCAIFNKGF